MFGFLSMSDQQLSDPANPTAATEDLSKIDAEKQKTGCIPSRFPSFINLEQPIASVILSSPNLETMDGKGIEIEDSETTETPTDNNGEAPWGRIPGSGARPWCWPRAAVWTQGRD